MGDRVYIHKGLEVHGHKGIILGNNVRLGRDCRLSCYRLEGKLGNILIEDNCYIGNRFSCICGADITISKNVLIASDVAIISENHGMDCSLGLLYGQQELIGNPVFIDESCWIGEKVIILPKVKIGKYAIIGAGSIVNKDIPPFSIAVGNPAKVIKKYNFDTKKWESA